MLITPGRLYITDYNIANLSSHPNLHIQSLYRMELSKQAHFDVLQEF